MSLFSLDEIAPIEDKIFLLKKNKWLNVDKRMAQSAKKNLFIKPANANEVLDHLPSKGNIVHGMLRGNFVLGEMLIALSEAHHVKKMVISTLSMNVDNAQKLAEQVKRGNIDKLDMFISQYFAHIEKIYPRCYKHLKDAGASITIGKLHTKVFLVHTEDNYYVFTGSGNLRSSDSVEALAIFNDKVAFDFYEECFNELNENLKKDGRKTYSADPDYKKQIM